MLDQLAGSFGTEPWMMPRDGKISGIYEGVPIRGGFGLVIADVEYSDDAYFQHVGGEYLKFQHKLTGGKIIKGEKEEFVPVESGQLSFLVQPSDSLKHEKIRADTHQRSITLVCSRDFATHLFPRSSNDMPSFIGDFLRNRVSQFSFASLPMTAQMRTIAEDLLRLPYAGAFRDVMLEAKALELLCFSVQHILNAPPIASPVRSRDRARVRDICAALEEHPEQTLSICELAKLVAWNGTQLTECFKQVTGMTISDYRHRVRMDYAKRQLHDTETSITEIAFNAGYEHPRNFATAFKRTFGFPPKMARNRLS